MKKYEIVLKNEKIKLYSRISWIVISVQSALLLYLVFYSSTQNYKNWSIATLLLLSVCFFLRSYLGTKWKFGFHPFYLFLLVCWICLGELWLAGITTVFDFLSAVALRNLVIMIYENKIIYPSFPAKEVTWNELNNVLLKDGLITIDFKNNKIIQQLVEESGKVSEPEFNDFCNKQLSSSHSPLTTNH